MCVACGFRLDRPSRLFSLSSSSTDQPTLYSVFVQIQAQQSGRTRISFFFFTRWLSPTLSILAWSTRLLSQLRPTRIRYSWWREYIEPPWRTIRYCLLLWYECYRISFCSFPEGAWISNLSVVLGRDANSIHRSSRCSCPEAQVPCCSHNLYRPPWVHLPSRVPC